MEIYNNLPESLQYHVNKMYMSNNVMPEFFKVHSQREELCMNCAHHGFPCLNCACYKYNGKLGPGFAENKRIMYANNEEIDEGVWFNMLHYILINNPTNLEIKDHFPEYPHEHHQAEMQV